MMVKMTAKPSPPMTSTTECLFAMTRPAVQRTVRVAIRIQIIAQRVRECR